MINTNQKVSVPTEMHRMAVQAQNPNAKYPGSFSKGSRIRVVNPNLANTSTGSTNMTKR